MSVSIKLVKATSTWKIWQEWADVYYQEYKTEDIKWFEDWTNDKKFVRWNDWNWLADDFYWKCKPWDYKEIEKYVKENMYEDRKDMYLKAIKAVKQDKDLYFEFDQ